MKYFSEMLLHEPNAALIYYIKIYRYITISHIYLHDMFKKEK